MTAALSITNLKKTYKDGFVALRGIDLEVKQGDFFALLGPNGAGKSTAIGIITSLVNKTSGSVKIFGHDTDKDFSAAKRHIGLVPQEFNFSMFEPIDEIVTNQAGYYGMSKPKARKQSEKYLKMLGLWDKRHSEARLLSGGMKRRMMIARAMVHEPDMLILDEPTAGVDIEIRRSMWVFLKEINKNGTTIILTTHYLEEAENLCRKIAIIDKGIIIENTSMKSLLASIQLETFILDIKDPLQKAPKIDGLNLHLRDDLTLELTINRETDLNQAFAQLTQVNIHVTSMRNKSNRLEELFIQRINNATS